MEAGPLRDPSGLAPLGLGCWSFGGRDWGGQSEQDSFAVMEAALAHGITHFDTARAYGVSEKVIGKFLRHRQDPVFLATKAYPGRDAESVRRAVEKSLEQLGTGFIDLYYLHWPRAGLDVRPQVEELVRARDAGLIGSIGVSNYGVGQLELAREVASIDYLQVGYHLLWRVVEADILPYCRRHGIRVVTYSSLGQGILTGKFPLHPQFPQGDHRSQVLHFQSHIWPEVHATVDQLKILAREAEQPLAHLALQWCASREGVHRVLVGARNREQMIEDAAALSRPANPDILDEMTRISDRLISLLPVRNHIFIRHD